ncbi:unnamed protein product, partial [Trypanosoma congolense IL3000]
MEEGETDNVVMQKQPPCTRVTLVDGLGQNNRNDVDVCVISGAPHANDEARLESANIIPYEGDVGKTIISSTRRKYAILPSASQNLLNITNLRAIERYIELNKRHRFVDRDKPPADVIPDAPFQRLHGGDEVLQMAVKTVHPRENALDMPLRFIAPECFRIPPLEDPPSNFPLARRVMALLKGAESVQPHWVERRPEAHGKTGGRDVVCVRVLKDAEFRRRTAMRSGDLLGTAIQFCTTASLHYNSGNMELARAFFGKALAAFEASGDVRGVAFCHNLLGICHYRLHQFKVALLHHKQQESLGGCYARAVAQINMAICYAALSEFDFADAALEDALANARACENG